MKKKYLIVGGGGFIGSHIVDSLLELRRDVRVFGRDKNNLIKNVRNYEAVEWVSGDLRNPSRLIGCLDGVTDIIYLAHSTVPATSMDNMAYDLESNVTPFVKFLESVSSSQTVVKFIYISSGGAVYGNPIGDEMFKESDSTTPVSSYGLTKLVSEHYLRLSLSGNRNIETFVLRVSNAYGERQNINNFGAVGVFLNRMTQKEKIVIYGDGSTIRDYIYVSDIASAVISCLEFESSISGGYTVLNVGSGRGASLNDLIELIENFTQRKLDVEYLKTRDFDCKYNVLDIKKIINLLGWEPSVSFNDGLSKTLLWINENAK